MIFETGKSLAVTSLMMVMLLISACASSDEKAEVAASNAAVAGESGQQAAAAESDKEAIPGTEDTMDPDRLICKIQRPTGSRIGEKVCLTARQWEMWQAQSQRELEKLRRNRPASLSSEG